MHAHDPKVVEALQPVQKAVNDGLSIAVDDVLMRMRGSKRVQPPEAVNRNRLAFGLVLDDHLLRDRAQEPQQVLRSCSAAIAAAVASTAAATTPVAHGVRSRDSSFALVSAKCVRCACLIEAS